MPTLTSRPMEKPNTRDLRCPGCGDGGGFVQGMEPNAQGPGWSWIYRCYGACDRQYAVSTSGRSIR